MSGGLTIGILTWNKPKVLRQTLNSYKASGLFDLADQVLVFLQENNADEAKLAARYGLTPMPSNTNVGIQQGLQEMLSKAEGEYFLFLENDWLCVEDKRITARRISQGIQLLVQGKAQCVRLRHRYSFGCPLYTLQFQGKERSAPRHFISCVHWVSFPEREFPDIFTHLEVEGESWFVADSRHANFTNNPTLYKKDFISAVLKEAPSPVLTGLQRQSQEVYARGRNVEAGKIALEGNIAEWWSQQGFTVAQGEGLFSHQPEVFRTMLRRVVISTLNKIRGRKHLKANKVQSTPIPQIAFTFAHRDTDIFSTPLSLVREFQRRGWAVRIFSLFDENDNYHEKNLVFLYDLIQKGVYSPDIIFHLNYTGFRSRYFARLNRPDVFTVFESADDPQHFAGNYPKAKNFKLILTPDRVCCDKYRARGHNALWWTHFCDDTVHKLYPDVERGNIAVSSRGPGSSDVLDKLSARVPNVFTNKRGMYGEDYGRFFCSAKIVVQHSRHKEVTRRIFEGMACGCLVLTDRLPQKTGIDELFTDKKELVLYDDVQDCENKILYYLSEAGDEDRKRIAYSGYEVVMKHHTQKQRVDSILEQYNAWRKEK